MGKDKAIELLERLRIEGANFDASEIDEALAGLKAKASKRKPQFLHRAFIEGALFAQRTSANRFPWLVVARADIRIALERAREIHDSDREDWRRWSEMVRWRENPPPPWPLYSQETFDKFTERRIASAEEGLMGATSEQEFLERITQKRIESVDEDLATGWFDLRPFHWCMTKRSVDEHLKKARRMDCIDIGLVDVEIEPVSP